MFAILIFHLKAGARIAVRSSVPLFTTILALIMLNVDPAATVTGLAQMIFAAQTGPGVALLLGGLAFLLPAKSASQVAHGSHGWIRHLSFDTACHRRGMLLALAVVQAPSGIALGCLAWVAHTQDLAVLTPSLRWLLVLFAGTLAAMPVSRRMVSMPVAFVAALLAIWGGWVGMLAAAGMLVGAEALSGIPVKARRRRPRRASPSFFEFRIAWRALGWRVGAIMMSALLPLAATGLFLRNNQPPLHVAAGAIRFGGSLAVAVVLAGLAGQLASRRRAWPLARSFPWSASHRIAMDAMFLALHAIVPVCIIAIRYRRAAASILTLLALLVLRAAADIRRMPGRQFGPGRLLLEGASLAALLSLLPWLSILFMLASPLAFLHAREAERSFKATSWSDRRHAAIGDPLSWSE